MNRPANQAKPAPPTKPSRTVGLALGALVVFGLGWFFYHSRSQVPAPTPTAAIAPAPDAPPERSDPEVFSAYAGSASCRDCHPAAYELWKNSHHGLAERPLNAALDQAAFEPPHTIHHGTQTSLAKADQGQFEVVTRGLDGQSRAFPAHREIGVEPLRQFLATAEGGRLQVLELAFDPQRKDWFDIFGDEDRQPGEWGHWTGRGMTWNMMCANCHNTRLRKHYQAASDQYQTTMAEMGVGCEACHGPMASHVKWQHGHPRAKAKDPTVRRITRDQMVAVCGGCHSRRAELTGEFQPGDAFSDHYTLTIPDDTEIYYPDGQVHDEDYEYTSFLSSRMFAAGVRCIDCHQPHSAKIMLPENALCLRCHGVPLPPAPKIDPAAHSHHRLDLPGGRCVDCHMPQTTYMQRHARRDHGFTIPDPLLTKTFGIPNACTRCHQNRDADWALAAVEQWYGPRMNRPTRTRAQWVAEARAGKPGAQYNLVKMLNTETNGLWRAVAANLLRRWDQDAAVTPALLKGTADYNPLVRAMSARALEPLAQENQRGVDAVLHNLLSDPVRAVRVEAAWAVRAKLDLNSLAARDLSHYLEFNRDQPSGLLQLASWQLERGETQTALAQFQQAVRWDQGSAPLRRSLAVAYSLAGQSGQAVKELEAACRLAPREAEYRFQLGLALNEVGRLPEATAALAETVKLDPQFAQAWYNLGLAYSTQGQTKQAIEALLKAEDLNPTAALFPYARATILARLGRTGEAREAATKALNLQPNYPDALNLLSSLSGQ